MNLPTTDFGEAVPWDAPVSPTPLADIEALRASASALPPPPRPAVADLTGDPACVGVLRAWAKRPWKREHLPALADRMGELGLERQAAWVRELAEPPADYAAILPWDWHLWGRRARGRMLPQWRATLAYWFGNFEAATLCGDDAPDTSPLPF